MSFLTSALADLHQPFDRMPLASAATAAAPLKVVFVTAEGGLGDRSFNDMINAGLNKAKADLGIEFVVI